MCGKTSIFKAFQTGSCPETHEPTIFDTYAKTIEIDTKTRRQSTIPSKLQVQFLLWDTAGQDEYLSLRQLAYQKVDVILLVFSIVDPETLENIRFKWSPEAKYYCRTATLILVGNKMDLRNERNRGTCVSEKRARRIGQEIGALDFIECSAVTGKNIAKIFETATTNNLTVQEVYCKGPCQEPACCLLQ